MKKHLLFATMLLAGVAFTPNVDAKSAMDSNLKMEWMNTDVASLHTSARQGIGFNDLFYLQNKDTKKIEVWGATGKVKDIDAGAAGTNITLDDANNIIVRVGTFNKNYTFDPEFKVITPEGKILNGCKLKNVSSGRVDFWGHGGGNVADKTTGGILLMGTQWSGKMSEINIVDCKENIPNSAMHTYMNPLKIGGQITTTTLISAWDFGEEDYSMAILSPYAGKTNCNSIQKLVYDQDLNIVHDSFYITPNHNSCSGFYIFQIGTQKYIIYSTGSNNADGFSIAKLATKADYAVEEGDKAYRVATKYAEAKDDGNVMYTNNAFYGNHFTVEKRDDNSVNIYQYVPNAYIAKYVFTPEAAGVEGVVEEKVSNVFTMDGKIFVEGEAQNIAVYNIAGALVSANETEVNVPAGVYVVNVDGNATKVLVR